MAAINNLVRGISTAGDIFNSVNGIIDIDYSAVKQRFLEALNSNSEYNYIVTGDSTRESATVDSEPYYSELLNQVNFNVIMNSGSGQSPEDWADNVDSPTVDEAINLTVGNGESSVLEYSLGINVGTASDEDELVANILRGLNKYIAAKPEAAILLVSPVKFSTSWDFEYVYEQVKSQLPKASLVSGLKATESVYGVNGNNEYYFDDTHPSENGMKRLINYIMSNALPVDSVLFMKTTDNPYTPTPTDPFNVTVINGFWRSSDGTFQDDDAQELEFRSLQLLDVEPNFLIGFDTGGNQALCTWFDANNNYLGFNYASQDPSDPSIRSIKIIPGAYKLGLTFESNGTDWDLLNYNVQVAYIQSSGGYMSQVKINEGNSIALPYIQNQSLDDAGSIGASGQVKTAQGDGTWLWV